MWATYMAGLSIPAYAAEGATRPGCRYALSVIGLDREHSSESPIGNAPFVQECLLLSRRFTVPLTPYGHVCQDTPLFSIARMTNFDYS